jgi:O-antigen/teichoic acid export membrane protein
MREAAKGRNLQSLIALIVPLRLLLATGSFAALFVLVPLFPDYPDLRMILLLSGLSLFAHAVSLGWIFLGQKKMARVAAGAVLPRMAFAAAIFALVHSREQTKWAPWYGWPRILFWSLFREPVC